MNNLLTAGVIVAQALSCPVTHIINHSQQPWTDHDLTVLQNLRQSKRCEIHYPDKPCVISFHKKAFHTYHVICGKKR